MTVKSNKSYFQAKDSTPTLKPILKNSLFKFSHDFHKIAIKKIKTKNN